MTAKKKPMRNFNVRMDDELVKQLDQLAETEHLDRSDIIRRFIYTGVTESKAPYSTKRGR